MLIIKRVKFLNQKNKVDDEDRTRSLFIRSETPYPFSYTDNIIYIYLYYV